jgi:hypothetical protein
MRGPRAYRDTMPACGPGSSAPDFSAPIDLAAQKKLVQPGATVEGHAARRHRHRVQASSGFPLDAPRYGSVP